MINKADFTLLYFTLCNTHGSSDFELSEIFKIHSKNKHHDCRIYWIDRYILHNTDRRASSSSSFIVHTDRLDDKDEIDESQMIQ